MMSGTTIIKKYDCRITHLHIVKNDSKGSEMTKLNLLKKISLFLSKDN